MFNVSNLVFKQNVMKRIEKKERVDRISRIGYYLIALMMLSFTMSATAKQNDDNSQEEIGIESWMTLPFDVAFQEEEYNLEVWMLTPFQTVEFEEELYIESWMVNTWLPKQPPIKTVFVTPTVRFRTPVSHMRSEVIYFNK